ncbi:MAG: N-acetyl-gamma-glutamyl-phosphate reductase [Oscillospiraceae bacterium]|nr:N-acetyl-gamma-glutamyl-phosphate reductase [Oscillospiraceae bacterium]
MAKVFIDGSAGTTGLRIYDRLRGRADIELITLDEELRKDRDARCDALNTADVAFLCLPDAAAVDAADMVYNAETVIIDTSTAHRTDDNWIYGFPELRGYRDAIAASKRIANPGCHASGFIVLVEPLVSCGVISADADISCFSLTGYSGGGKQMIAEYEAAENAEKLAAPRLYGLSQSHKHLPEIVKVCKLLRTPAFCPIVSSYYSGMEVAVTLFGDMADGGADRIKSVYREYYTGKIVRFKEAADEGGFMSASAMSGRDDMEISVYGNGERITLIARFDNLGKGASGAAIQNMNIALGVDETEGLNIGG